MKMNRGIWVVLAAVILVAMGLFVSQSINGPVVPPTPPGPTSPEPGAKGAAAGSSAVENSDQKPAAAPAAQSKNEAASSPRAPASALADNKEAAAARSPSPAPPPPGPASQTTAAASAAASSPAPAPAPVVETAAKEVAPTSTPTPGQPAAASPGQTAAKETASGPAAGEKGQARVDRDALSHANDKAKAELSVAALNDSVINFASDSAEVPASAMEFLRKAADDLKQLPAGQVVEIAGYTDNTGNEALNVALSQRRADAVRDALMNFGAAPDMLVAKGYGSADPIASNDMPEGRKRNRRIEYHIVKTPT
jgi:outer membrane protein OmpA-like peptidoglycan-associated protein